MNMRTVVRWLLRNVILLVSEEWGNAREEMQAMQAVHKIKTLCDSEQRIFRAGLTGLERLQAEAARAIARYPASQKLIVEMLQDRMVQLAHSVNEKSKQKRPAA
jgi:hypothetical protein